LWDYTVQGTETSRDLKLMQMDHTVQGMVKTVDELETALASPAFVAPPNAAPKDAQALAAMRQTLRGVLDAQKVQLDAMSGFVETERMSRFGKMSESEANLARSNGQETLTGNPLQPNPNSTEAPNFAFLRDSSQPRPGSGRHRGVHRQARGGGLEGNHSGDRALQVAGGPLARRAIPRPRRG
jgi:hypothetical protein